MNYLNIWGSEWKRIDNNRGIVKDLVRCSSIKNARHIGICLASINTKTMIYLK